MFLNGKDVRRYAMGHSEEAIGGAHQFLEYFGCCPELEKMLADLIDEWHEMNRERAEMLRFNAELVRRRETDEVIKLGFQRDRAKTVSTRKPCKKEQVEEEKRIVEAPPLFVVIGKCPACDGDLVGEPVPMCERKKSGRNFYAECKSCTYYYEVFYKKKRNKYKYIKIEGGV